MRRPPWAGPTGASSTTPGTSSRTWSPATSGRSPPPPPCSQPWPPRSSGRLAVDDLIAFLRARLDEDEQAARAATPGPWRHNPNKHWRKPGTSWFEEAVFAGPPGEDATCIAGTGETDDPQS